MVCHIKTEKEEIICTPNHNILTEDGWKIANELTSKDKIKTSNGFIQVLSIEIEHLKENTKVYNLNVLGYHTYVVGNGLLVVHNSCKKQNIEVSSKQEAIEIANSKLGNNQKIVFKNGKEFHVSEDGLRTWRFDYHSYKGGPGQNHINVERWKYPFGTKNNRLLENIHIWF